MRDLPPFNKRNRDDVLAYISLILMNEQSSDESHFIDLLEYDDGHYRVLFSPTYFVLQNGQAEPTKSQWNSLKKKLKRHDVAAFVFKDYGQIDEGDRRYYLDFGFMPDLPISNEGRRR